MTASPISFIYKTKGKLPRLPFANMKNEILGEDYELTIVSATNNLSKKLNNEYRQKNYPTNILSFPLSKKEGEIILDLKTIKKEAPSFNMSYTNFLGFLVIHGMLHLKGMEHGSTMERQEKKWCKKFSIEEK